MFCLNKLIKTKTNKLKNNGKSYYPIVSRLYVKEISGLIAATVLLSFIPYQAEAAVDRNQVIGLNNEGVQALKTNNYALAIQKFESCLKLDPTYKLARDNLAIAYNNYGISLQNSPQQALEKFHKSLFYSPENPTAVQNLEVTIQNLGKDPRSFKDRIALGKQARTSTDLEGAAVEFGEALKIKDDPKLRVDLGDVLRVKDQVDRAIDQYKVAAQNDSLDLDSKVRAFTSLGQCYQSKQDYPNAVKAYDAAITLDRTNKETLLANVTVWQDAVRKDPTNADNHVGLGQAYEYVGDFGQAKAEFMQALTLNRGNQAAQQLLNNMDKAKTLFERDKHINQGVDLQSRKLYDAAIQEYNMALSVDPSYPDTMVNLGSAYMEKSELKAASDWFTKALQKDPQNQAAQEGLKNAKERLQAKMLDDAAQEGAKLFTSGNYNDALQRYQTVLNSNPKDPAAHFNMGACFQALKRFDEAISQYQQASDLAPSNDSYKQALVKAKQDKADPIISLAVKKHAAKDYAGAIDLYQQALAITPDNNNVLFDLAGAYFAREQYPEAQKLYEQLYKKDPKGQVDDLWLIGTIQEHFQHGTDALATYTRYLSEAPAGRYIAQAKIRQDNLRKNPTDCQKIKGEAELAQDKTAEDAYNQAVKFQQQKDWDNALALYQKAISIHPKDPANYFAPGTMFKEKGDIDQALKYFQQAVDLASADAKFDKKILEQFKQAIITCKDDKARPILEDAAKKLTGGDALGAVDAYKQALQAIPNNARVWTNLGQAYQLADDFANARASYQKAVDLDSKGEGTDWYLIAKIDEHFSQGQVAIDHYRKYLLAAPTGQYVSDSNSRLAALSKNPTNTQKLPTQNEIKSSKLADEEFNQGLSLQQAGNAKDAIAHYQKACSIKPDEPAFAQALATAFQAVQDYDNALANYDRAIDLAKKSNKAADANTFSKQKEACAELKAAPIVDQALAAYNASNFIAAADLYKQVIQIVPNIAKMHTSRAAALQAADDFNGALIEYQEAFKLDPKGEKENLYIIGALQEHFGKGAQALESYRKYLTESPGGQYAQAARQRADALAKDITKIVKMPTSGERKSQEQIAGLYDEAVKLYNAGKYEESASKLQQVLGLAKDAVYYYQLSAAYLGSKKYDEALAAANEACRLEPSNKDYTKFRDNIKQAQLAPIVDNAVKLQQAGDMTGAIAGYREGLKMDPNNASIHTNLASALQATEDFNGAYSEFQKALGLDRKGQIDNLYFLAILDENFSRGTQALQEYNTYLREVPRGTYAQIAQTRAKALTTNINDLQKIVTQAEQQKASATNEAYQAGIQLQQDGKIDEAIAKYQEAMKLNPNEVAIIFALATAYHAKPDLDQAITYYEKAIALKADPQWKTYLKQAKQAKAAPLIQEAIQKQTTADAKGAYDLAGAIVLYEQALRLDDDPTTRLNLGTAYQANNNLPKALENYKRAVTVDPNQFDGYYYLGTVYEALKQPALAIQEYKKYVLKQPTGPNAATCKDRLKILGQPIK